MSASQRVLPGCKALQWQNLHKHLTQCLWVLFDAYRKTLRHGAAREKGAACLHTCQEMAVSTEKVASPRKPGAVTCLGKTSKRSQLHLRLQAWTSQTAIQAKAKAVTDRQRPSCLTHQSNASYQAALCGLPCAPSAPAAQSAPIASGTTFVSRQASAFLALVSTTSK